MYIFKVVIKIYLVLYLFIFINGSYYIICSVFVSFDVRATLNKLKKYHLVGYNNKLVPGGCVVAGIPVSNAYLYFILLYRLSMHYV